MKKVFLVLVLGLMAICDSNLYSQTLHAIIFAKSDDPTIGESCYLDYDNMQIELSSIAAATGMSIKEYYFCDENSSYDNLIRTLQRLQCNENDVVFFYYTGHGGRAVSEKTQYPQMALGHRDKECVPLYKVDEMIAQKNPRFRIVMADCCNSVVSGLSSKELCMSSKATCIKDVSMDNYRSLFAKVKGSVLVCSSSVGETSGCHPDVGGYFTASFLYELGDIVSKSDGVNWNILLERTKSTTCRIGRHTPLYEVHIDNGSVQPSPAPQTQVSSSNELIANLLQLTVNNTNKSQRIKLIHPVMDKFFSSSAVIEVYGRDHNTLLARDRVEDYLSRIATSSTLIGFVELAKETDGSGRITRLKLHEIYKQ